RSDCLLRTVGYFGNDFDLGKRNQTEAYRSCNLRDGLGQLIKANGNDRNRDSSVGTSEDVRVKAEYASCGEECPGVFDSNVQSSRLRIGGRGRHLQQALNGEVVRFNIP